MTDPPTRRLRVLHLVLMLGETNSQYNEHCLPMIGERDLSIVTYFTPRLSPPPEIHLSPGDGTIRGFFRALRRALDGRTYDAIHAHAPESAALLLAALVLWGRLRRWRRTLVYTVHDSFYDYSLRNQALMLLTLGWFRRVVFCSRAARDSYPWPWLRVVGSRSRIVQNGADLDRVGRAIATAPRRGSHAFTVVSVGRLERVKDPTTMVDAFAGVAVGNDRLVMIGTGPLEPELASRARQAGLNGRFEMTGLIARDDVFRRCASADVFVSTSRGEGLPVAVIEAMATGRPAILSDISPHREVVDDAAFIPLVPPGDVDGFAAQIRRLRDMPAQERRRIGERCRELAHARFRLERMHAGYETVYRELIRELRS